MTSMIKCCSILLITSIGILLYSCAQEPDQNSASEESAATSELEEIPLIYHMSFISRYAKKLYFAGEAKNWELADIYSHEIEEISEGIIAKEEVHDGVNISQLMETMLLPGIEQLEEAIDNGDRELFMDRYNVLIQSCNNCHKSSDYGAVKVTVPQSNSFNQNFSVDSE